VFVKSSSPFFSTPTTRRGGVDGDPPSAAAAAVPATNVRHPTRSESRPAVPAAGVTTFLLAVWRRNDWSSPPSSTNVCRRDTAFRVAAVRAAYDSCSRVAVVVEDDARCLLRAEDATTGNENG
jgi:hypothetical protein